MPRVGDEVEFASDLQWEQCARMLLCLSAAEIQELHECVVKIVNNILNNPDDLKYSRLRFQNKALQSKILSKNGGLEVLLSFGFEVEISPADNEKYLYYPILQLLASDGGGEEDRAEVMELLTTSLEWLENTVRTSLNFVQQKLDVEANVLVDIAAQSLIQVQLPTQKIVLGGFLLGDLVEDVRKFAASFFQTDRQPHVILKLAHDLSFDFEPFLECSIEELQLFPRAKVLALLDENALVVKQNSDGAQVYTPSSARFQHAHDSGETEALKEQQAKVREEKRRREEERKQEERRRALTLQAFQEDRKKKNATWLAAVAAVAEAQLAESTLPAAGDSVVAAKKTKSPVKVMPTRFQAHQIAPKKGKRAKQQQQQQQLQQQSRSKPALPSTKEAASALRSADRPHTLTIHSLHGTYEEEIATPGRRPIRRPPAQTSDAADTAIDKAL